MLYENTVTMIPHTNPKPVRPSLSNPNAAVVACGPPPARLLDQVRERIRYLHYSIRTEEAYVHWVKAFVRFHGLRHPKGMGQEEVQVFLSWLAVERHVSAGAFAFN